MMVGNGNNLTFEGYIPYLSLLVQGDMVHILMYLLSFTGGDLVMGAPWLKTLVPHIVDYDTLSIKLYL